MFIYYQFHFFIIITVIFHMFFQGNADWKKDRKRTERHIYMQEDRDSDKEMNRKASLRQAGKTDWKGSQNGRT